MADLAKLFMVVGSLMVLVGLGIHLLGKVPGIGKLPGDILVKKENFTFYFPLTTSIVLSLILSLIFYLFNKR